MSAEPPPPDWVRSDAAFHNRRSILDAEEPPQTRSIPRVTLEPSPRASVLGDPERSAGGPWGWHAEAGQAASAHPDAGFLFTVRREWEDLAFTTLRRSQLIAFLGFVVVLALAVYGWQRGTLSGVTAGISAEQFGEGAPAAPRVSSDQVGWGDVPGDEGGDGRRSTASFASDRGFAGPDDDQPTSGAKLFVADGKRSSKRDATTPSDNASTDDTARSGSRIAATGAADDGSSGGDETTRKRAGTTTATTVRYENCSEATAAGAAPIRLGEPGYRLSLDQDKDGVACENGSTPEDPGDAPVDSLYSNSTTTTTDDSAAATTASTTGAGTTTSTAQSTTTSGNSTTGSTTTTTNSTSTASTATTTTPSTSASTTSTTSSTTSTTSSPTTSTTSSTTTTRPSTTSSTTTTTAAPTSTPSTSTTISSTTDPPPTDPVGLQPTGPA